MRTATKTNLSKYTFNENGTIVNNESGKEVKGAKGKNGMTFTLTNDDGKTEKITGKDFIELFPAEPVSEITAPAEDDFTLPVVEAGSEASTGGVVVSMPKTVFEGGSDEAEHTVTTGADVAKLVIESPKLSDEEIAGLKESLDLAERDVKEADAALALKPTDALLKAKASAVKTIFKAAEKAYKDATKGTKPASEPVKTKTPEEIEAERVAAEKAATEKATAITAAKGAVTVAETALETATTNLKNAKAALKLLEGTKKGEKKEGEKKERAEAVKLTPETVKGIKTELISTKRDNSAENYKKIAEKFNTVSLQVRRINEWGAHKTVEPVLPAFVKPTAPPVAPTVPPTEPAK